MDRRCPPHVLRIFSPSALHLGKQQGQSKAKGKDRSQKKSEEGGRGRGFKVLKSANPKKREKGLQNPPNPKEGESSPKQQTLFPQRDMRNRQRDARAHEGETARQEQDFRENEDEKKKKRRKDRVVGKCAFLRKRLGIGAQSTVVSPMRQTDRFAIFVGSFSFGRRLEGNWSLGPDEEERGVPMLLYIT